MLGVPLCDGVLILLFHSQFLMPSHCLPSTISTRGTPGQQRRTLDSFFAPLLFKPRRRRLSGGSVLKDSTIFCWQDSPHDSVRESADNCSALDINGQQSLQRHEEVLIVEMHKGDDEGLEE
jgi:hypothetical protein